MFKLKGKEKIKIFKRKNYSYTRKLKVKKLKLIENLRTELRESTVHGLPYIANAEINWFERLFWFGAFIFANCIIYLLIFSQYTRFLEAPVLTSVEKDYFNWNVSYPSIILCPTNKLDEDLLTDLVNDTLSRTGQDIGQYLRAIASVSLETLHFLRVPSEEIVSLLDPKEYAKICAALFKKFDKNSLTTMIKWPVTVEETMTEMGMCHSINSNIAVFDNPSKWSDTDIVYKKSNIELFFYDKDFFIEIMNYADEYKIYTSSPDDVVLNTASSLTFDSKGFLWFGIHISTIKALADVRSMPLSLRKCRFMDEAYEGRYPVYSYNRCLMECRIKMILKFCGCIPHLYKPLENEKICSLLELKCILTYNREIITLTASNETLEKLDDISNIPRTSRDCGCLADCEADVYQYDNAIFIPEDDLNKLKISVSTFPKVKFVRQIMFTFYDLFLRGGSIVNLCIGTSVISIMELLLIIIRIPIYTVVKFMQFLLKNNYYITD